MRTLSNGSALAICLAAVLGPRAAAACSLIGVPPGVDPFAPLVRDVTLGAAATGAAMLLALVLWARTRRFPALVVIAALLFAVHPRWRPLMVGDCGDRLAFLNVLTTGLALAVVGGYAAVTATLDARGRRDRAGDPGAAV